MFFLERAQFISLYIETATKTFHNIDARVSIINLFHNFYGLTIEKNDLSVKHPQFT